MRQYIGTFINEQSSIIKIGEFTKSFKYCADIEVQSTFHKEDRLVRHLDRVTEAEWWDLPNKRKKQIEAEIANVKSAKNRYKLKDTFAGMVISDYDILKLMSDGLGKIMYAYVRGQIPIGCKFNIYDNAGTKLSIVAQLQRNVRNNPSELKIAIVTVMYNEDMAVTPDTLMVRMSDSEGYDQIGQPSFNIKEFSAGKMNSIGFIHGCYKVTPKFVIMADSSLKPKHQEIVRRLDKASASLMHYYLTGKDYYKIKLGRDLAFTFNDGYTIVGNFSMTIFPKGDLYAGYKYEYEDPNHQRKVCMMKASPNDFSITVKDVYGSLAMNKRTDIPIIFADGKYALETV